MTSRTLWTALALTLLLPAAADAQREGYSYLSYVGPEVSLVSTAEDDAAARPNTPILVGDRISTGSSSRAEAILADGNVLRVDVQTDLRFDRLARTYESEDERNAVFLERGAVSLEHRISSSRDEATRIDTDDATILFPDRGLLRVETGRRGTEVYVLSGRAEVYARSGRSTLRAGQYAFASGDAELEVDWQDEPRDRFARFVAERRDLGSGRSGTTYVSEEYGYDYAVADFDRHGSWVSLGGSWCWRPTVSAGWRPYVDGYWRWSPAGLTWVSYEPWGWLPYHYGSWFWDTGFGWCWSPAYRYSPAWVYWSYTPSWVGWCPIGYYGGYWDRWDRSQRRRSGSDRWNHAYPHLRGRVDVTRVDPRGWSWASVSRLGTRFDTRRDVLGHEAVRFPAGERGVVVTTPLRIERGQGRNTAVAVQDAVRRVPLSLGAESRPGRGDADVTPILRRDGNLGTAEREVLRRSFVTPGQDPAYRPVGADQVVAPRREGSVAGTVPSRGADRSGTATLPGRGSDVSAPRRSAAPSETWRGPAGTASGAEAAPRRSGEAPLTGGFGRERDVRGDDGWRSPAGERRSESGPSRTFDVPARRAAPAPEASEAPSRSGTRARAPEPWRDGGSDGRRGSPSSEPPSSAPERRAVPAPRGDEGWRGGDGAPRSAPAPRPEPPSRTYEAPSRSPEPAPRTREAPSRSYEAPSRSWEPPARSSEPPARSYDRPSRSESSSSRSYDAPPRSYSPPSRSYDAPSSRPSSPPSRSYDAPSSRSSSPPSRSYDAPSRPSGGSSGSSSSRGGDAPRRSSSRRG